MEKPSGKVGSDRRTRLIKVSALVVGGIMILAIAAWIFVPRLTEHLLGQQLERIEDRAGLAVEAQSFNTQGLSGVEMREVAISLPGADEPLGTIDEIDASASLWQAARGQPAVSALRIEGVAFEIHRRADGSSDLDEILAQLRGEDDGPIEDEEEDLSRQDAPVTALMQQVLRHFGGRYPDVQVRDVDIAFTHHEDAQRWPLDRIATDEFWMDGDASEAPFGADFEIDSSSGGDIQLPEHIALAGTMRLPAEESTFSIDIDPELRIANLAQLPYAEVSISGLSVPDEYTVEILSPTLDSSLHGEAQTLAAADRVQAQFNRWSRSPSRLTVVELELDGPRAFVEYNESGASNLQEIYSVLRQPSAQNAAATARNVGDAIALAEASEEDDDDNAELDETTAPPGPVDRMTNLVSDFPIEKWLAERLPRRTTLRDVRVVVDDARDHETLTRPARHLEFAGDLLELRHSPLNGVLEGDVQFQLEADDHSGSADVQFEIPYRSGDWNASVDIESLELAHLSQLGGPRLARHLHGGEVTATVDIANENDATTTRFDGLLAIRQMRVFFAGIADDPIEVDSASLHLDGFYDPELPLPPARLIDEDDDEDETEDEELVLDDDDDDVEGDEEADQPPNKGGFVIDEAVARLGELEATVDFAVYGIESSRRPNRTSLQIALEPTPLQTIADAIPAAIRGPLDGIEMLGTLAWDFDLEVPLYEASNMAWDATVDLSPDFEIVYLPDEVDVFKLTDEFEHTIRDEWKAPVAYREREFSYERTITIPEMKPTPARWLLENTSQELEQIDAIRRQREWPPIPLWDPSLGLNPEDLDTPEFWLTSVAANAAAERPWEDAAPSEDEDDSWWKQWADSRSQEEPSESIAVDSAVVLPVEEMVYQKPDPPEYHQTEIEVDPDRHGTYVYVPLHHVSPYMIRAIMTTEDTSFFRHSGFNYLAIRQSVEANLEAGRYVRGASTISMQLAKNLFLERDRVMSRKLQEVALVWLMESVADIPKERMMELYLNIIEFGPGIYGIHEASVYYFGKRPDELTIAEVAWLVSIVPSPKRHHQYYERREITPYWFRRMSRYIRAMYWRDRISEAEMEEAMESDPPAFYIPEDGDPLLDIDDTDTIDPDTSIEEADEDQEFELEIPTF